MLLRILMWLPFYRELTELRKQESFFVNGVKALEKKEKECQEICEDVVAKAEAISDDFSNRPPRVTIIRQFDLNDLDHIGEMAMIAKNPHVMHFLWRKREEFLHDMVLATDDKRAERLGMLQAIVAIQSDLSLYVRDHEKALHKTRKDGD